MVLILSFTNVMCHIDWFADIEPALHSRNKSHLIVVSNSSSVLLDLIGYYLVENFCIRVKQGNWSVALLFSGVFGLGIKVILAS